MPDRASPLRSLVIPALVVSLLGPACAMAAELRALEGRLDAIRERHGVAGFAFAIVQGDGSVSLGGGGLAEREPARPVGPEVVWRVGSITKSVTAIATLIAARRTGFDLDDPVARWVPDPPFTNRWESTHPVRIAHLLEHTAGLLDLSRREFDSSDPAPLSLEQAFAVDPGARVVQWQPGVHSSYSNQGAGIAALVIERKTGLSFDDFVQTEVLQRLGMKDAGLRLDPRTKDRLARGYDRDGRSPMPYWHVLFRAFGGLNATTADMGRYVSWLLRPASVPILTPEELSRLETPATTLSARSGLRYGYALGLYQYVHEGILWTGHGGDADGYLSRLGYVRDAGIGYFLVINAFNGEALEEMQETLESALTKDLPRKPVPAPVALSSEALQSLAGCYAAATRRFNWTTEDVDQVLAVRVENGHLVARNPMGRERHWYPVNARHFRRHDEPVATLAFVDDEAGTRHVQGDMGNLVRTKSDTTEPCPPPP